MTCPVCCNDTRVTYTVKDVDAIHRRRVCKSCKHVFFTTEIEQKTAHLEFMKLFYDIQDKYKKEVN